MKKEFDRVTRQDTKNINEVKKVTATKLEGSLDKKQTNDKKNSQKKKGRPSKKVLTIKKEKQDAEVELKEQNSEIIEKLVK